jgi:ferrochelatase
MAWFRGVPELTVEPADVGVLVVNLGTPTRPDYGPIRRYLGQFLGDRRVVEACPAYWYPILYGPILTFRPLRTAKLYRKIWMPEGSPLLVYSKRLAERMQAAYAGQSVRVELGMTYGEPSISAAVQRLQAARVQRLIVLPLYPQYSGSTSGAVFDAMARELRRWRRVPELVYVAEYYAEPSYIDALADTVRDAWATAGGRSHLVCSYHGIPTKYVDQGDPYQEQVGTTTRLLAQALGLRDDEWSQTFQSRFGPATWLQPYTDELLVEKAQSGTKAVTIVTPSFPVDCLETLEEIGVESKRKFLEAGGESFTLVPALNDSPAHVQSLVTLLRRYGVGTDRAASVRELPAEPPARTGTR